MRYHTGYNPLVRNHRSDFGSYDVTYMCDGAWMYIMDDFGNAVEVPTDSHAAAMSLYNAGLSHYRG